MVVSCIEEKKGSFLGQEKPIIIIIDDCSTASRVVVGVLT